MIGNTGKNCLNGKEHVKLKRLFFENYIEFPNFANVNSNLNSKILQMKNFNFSKRSGMLAISALATGFAFAQTASLTEVTPEPGSYFGQKSASGVTVFFEPADVTIESAEVVYTPKGSTTTTTESISCSRDEYRPGNPWDIGLMENVLYHVAMEQAELGSTFDVVLNNVTYNGTPVTTTSLNSTDIKFEDGNIILTYKVYDVIFTATEQTWPTTFYANWSDVDAISTATIVCNEEIERVGSISYRNDNSEYGVEGGNEDVEYGDFPLSICTIEGNTITLDFSSLVTTFRLPTRNISVYVIGVTSVSGQSLPSVPTGHMSYVDNSSSTGVNAVESINGEVRYYNLLGNEIINPEKGQIVIKVQDGKTYKTVIR